MSILETLPFEILFEVLSYLEEKNFLLFSTTNKSYYLFCKDKELRNKVITNTINKLFKESDRIDELIKEKGHLTKDIERKLENFIKRRDIHLLKAPISRFRFIQIFPLFEIPKEDTEFHYLYTDEKKIIKYLVRCLSENNREEAKFVIEKTHKGIYKRSFIELVKQDIVDSRDFYDFSTFDYFELIEIFYPAISRAKSREMITLIHEINKKYFNLKYNLLHNFNENIEILRTLISLGYDINETFGYSQGTLLHTFNKNVESVKLLVEKGLDPFQRCKNGFLPIHCKENVEIIKYYISLGVDVNTTTYDGSSVLQCLAFRNVSNKESYKFLLKNGANANHLNHKKENALFGLRNMEIVELLIEHGADPFQINIHGETVLSRLSKDYDDNLIKFYISLGVSEKSLSMKKLEMKK